MRILYYECFSGISGDMNLSAMVAAGVPFEYLKQELKKLNLGGYQLACSVEKKHGISGTQVKVLLDNASGEHKKHRHLSTINKIINDSTLGDDVKKTAQAIFRIVGEAEAKVHNIDIERIHFHEVGAIDSIVDIVGAAICYHYLKPDKVICSGIELGGGFVQCAHGKMPVPAPATAEILTNIPTRRGAVNSEATTPTGAAILKHLVDDYTNTPELVAQRLAYGIGQKDFDIPNVLRCTLGTIKSGTTSDSVVLLETNIDDLPAEELGYLMDLLFENRALEVFYTPVYMKKNRPAVQLTVLATNNNKETLKQLIYTETGTLGIREQQINRSKLVRKIINFLSSLGQVDIKLAFAGEKLVTCKPEYDQCVVLAKKHQLALKAVRDKVLNEFKQHGHTGKV